MKAARHYWLARHVYASASAQGAVFLDTRRDRYFGLGGAQLRALAMTVHDWPAYDGSADSEAPVTGDFAVRVADLLVEAGLLTRDVSRGKTARPPEIDIARIACGLDTEAKRRIGADELARFLFACTQARWRLKCRSLESIVAGASQRNARGRIQRAAVNERQLIELVSAFRRLRTYLFTAQDRCLLHALTLLYFLNGYGIFPTWIIGVKSDPWAAHSWVQHGRYVLDATPEAVRFYTPILAV